MNRPNIRSKFSVLTPQYIEAFLLKIQYAAKFIDEVPHLYSHRRDPNNEPYINLAIVTQANYLVSRDNDLLDLMRDSSFGAAYPDMTICTPEQFLTILKSL